MWTSASLPRTEEVVPGSGFFAKHGLDGLSQPDNHQGRKGEPRRDEECVVAALSLKGAQGEKEDDRVWVPYNLIKAFFLFEFSLEEQLFQKKVNVFLKKL